MGTSRFSSPHRTVRPAEAEISGAPWSGCCRRRGAWAWGKLLVATVRPAIAGSPNGSVPARSSEVERRFFTKETRPNKRTVAPLLDWSDIAEIWASTQIGHKATAVPRGTQVLRVPSRGAAALAEAVEVWCGTVPVGNSSPKL